MAGHMGDRRVTTLNIQVVAVDAEQGVIMLKGAVPGAEGGLRIGARQHQEQEAEGPEKFVAAEGKKEKRADKPAAAKPAAKPAA